MKFFMHIAAVVGALVFATTAEAQSGSSREKIPAAYRPPAGMCRIWIDGVPANKQPAPTDCATAIRNRPANGRVVFGDRRAKPDYEAPQSPREDDRERPSRATPRREPETRPTPPRPAERRESSEQRPERRRESSSSQRQERRRSGEPDERKERRSRDPS